MSLKRVNLRAESFRDYVGLSLLGLLWMLNLLCFYAAVQVSSVAVAVLSFSTFPIFIAFLEPLLAKRLPKVSDLLLAMVTFGGILLVIPSYDFSNTVLHGVLFGTASGLSLSLLSIFSKQYTQKYPSTLISFYQNTVAAVALMVVVYMSPVEEVTFQDVSLMVVLGVVFSAVPQLLLYQSLSKLKATTVSIILSLESVYGIVLALLLLGEVPSMRMVFGGLVILCASVYVSLQRH